MSSHYGGSHFASSHHLSSHYGREVIIPSPFTPSPTFPPGMGRQAQIIREDEEIMAIIVAFLHMQGR